MASILQKTAYVAAGAGVGSLICAGYFLDNVKRTHIMLPTSISSVPQFFSSVLNRDETLFVPSKMELQLNSKELELQNVKTGVVVEKAKDPLVEKIESEMSQAKKLPDGFKIVRESPRATHLEGSYKEESIFIEVSKPKSWGDSYWNMPLTLKVQTKQVKDVFLFFCREKVKEVEFHCTVSSRGCEIDAIVDLDGKVEFSKLPKNMQTDIYKYLEIRGVNSETTLMLATYMGNAINREIMGRLQKKFE